MFAETSFGFAYVYLDSNSDVNLIESNFLTLPEIGSGDMAAPIVIMDVNMDITNTTFEGNTDGFRSEAVIVAESSNVDFLNVNHLRPVL